MDETPVFSPPQTHIYPHATTLSTSSHPHQHISPTHTSTKKNKTAGERPDEVADQLEQQIHDGHFDLSPEEQVVTDFLSLLLWRCVGGVRRACLPALPPRPSTHPPHHHQHLPTHHRNRTHLPTGLKPHQNTPTISTPPPKNNLRRSGSGCGTRDSRTGAARTCGPWSTRWRSTGGRTRRVVG